jgi:hypothetical protein
VRAVACLTQPQGHRNFLPSCIVTDTAWLIRPAIRGTCCFRPRSARSAGSRRTPARSISGPFTGVPGSATPAAARVAGRSSPSLRERGSRAGAREFGRAPLDRVDTGVHRRQPQYEALGGGADLNGDDTRAGDDASGIGLGVTARLPARTWVRKGRLLGRAARGRNPVQGPRMSAMQGMLLPSIGCRDAADP